MALINSTNMESILDVILSTLDMETEFESRDGYKPGQLTTGANNFSKVIDGKRYTLNLCINVNPVSAGTSRVEKQAAKSQEKFVADLKKLTPEQRAARLASLKELEAEFDIA